ncbi:FMN reductase [Polaribacter pacificus]|uniref:FMN reductase n=1 Tax=Polaribacter pacificus TaxID=1775173 RepID=A0A917I113_9FLAO|nr:NAD(P)H-dependent oxidoreductase [Polaribacter pacificus]GGH00550.1 FMN reductase [Polaribacter pacificus]
MKKIIAFAGSNSKESINKKLAVYAANRVDQVEVQVLDLNDFPLPIYGIDEEKENGIPLNAKAFLEHLHSADGIVLSLAEHNGNFSTAFKNLFDWMSRIQKNFWNKVPMLLLSTSPGANGAKSVLGIAKNGFPHMGGNIVADFSLPTFNNNFLEDQLVDASLQEQLDAALLEFKKHL